MSNRKWECTSCGFVGQGMGQCLCPIGSMPGRKAVNEPARLRSDTSHVCDFHWQCPENALGCDCGRVYHPGKGIRE